MKQQKKVLGNINSIDYFASHNRTDTNDVIKAWCDSMLPPKVIYPLFAFSDGRIIIITRGVDENQAMAYAARDGGSFPRGVTVFPLDHLPINAAKLYDQNHEDGWLYRMPVWVRKQQEQQDIDHGVNNTINDVYEVLTARKALRRLMNI